MKITIGEWKTRDGRKVIVAGVNESVNDSEQVIGWVGAMARRWYTNGLVLMNARHDCDLVEPWTDPVPWDWSTTPPWINWIAMDESVNWYMYDTEPVVSEKSWGLTGENTHRIPKSHSPKWSGDWKLSKTMRPGYKEVK